VISTGVEVVTNCDGTGHFEKSLSAMSLILVFVLSLFLLSVCALHDTRVVSEYTTTVSLVV